MERDPPSVPDVPEPTPSAPDDRREVVFVDADDTLWENNRYFLAVIREWTRFMTGLGVGPERATAELEACEDRNIPRTGYGSAPFAASLTDAFERLVPEPDPTTQGRFEHLRWWCERGIRDHPILLLAGVETGLARLAESRRVVVLTKGRDGEQRAKVARSGLLPLLDGTLVVPEKRTTTYVEACRRLAVPVERAWMIGNSPRSDVNPARTAGLRTVLVPHEAPWHRDLAAPLASGPPTYVVDDFGGAVEIVSRVRD